MSRLRFPTARALLESFNPLIIKLAVAPTDESPLVFLRNLSAQEKLDDAVTFCAHLLPRREAVWWACGSTRTLLGDIPQSRGAGLRAAEAWVHDPDDQHREAALRVGAQGDANDSLTWLALAAGWSGGMLKSHPQMQIAMPPYMTARAARIAILLSGRFVKPPERTLLMRASIANGIELAESGL
jgi:hypothetical protein